MENKKTIPIFQGNICDFPSSEELPQGVKTVELKDTFGYPFRFMPEVVYARRSGETQKLHLLLPRFRRRFTMRKQPFVLCV